MDHYNMDHHDSGLASNSSSNNAAPFKLDEGFAEDSQQQDDSQIQNSFEAWLNTQPQHVKANLAYEILRTLRSAEIAAVIERLNPLLHMDPVDKLPPEITSQIFSYLDAKTLLTASLLSPIWRARILDPKLWQELYKSQGWGIDLDEVQRYEEYQRNVVRDEFRKAKEEQKQRVASTYKTSGQPLFKRRATSDWLSSTQRRVSAQADTADWREQHDAIEADPEPIDPTDAEMIDVSAQSPQRPNKRSSQDSGDEMNYSQTGEQSSSMERDHSNLVYTDHAGRPRMFWPQLYKQRHKLEQNWQKGRFTAFQLPHPDHPLEGHAECVYTIQFFGNWLVSGSRDKTIRVWDLETQRLRGKPLAGHSQSVLCLQFDPTPEEDIIVSGSSDSSLIVWKFSTGEKVHVIKNAHEESVLNLRFDHRYLVTCSKDKKIKVWNRRELLPTNSDYPTAKDNVNCKVPNHIIDTATLDISTLEARLANGTYKALKPFTLLMTFEGHNAAVNAIQIYGARAVSASGDRLIRVWDLETGQCARVIPGHQKGIACVQYDGKRIVSGSSDNSVRIYDPITATEVAVLMGHTNLVRTVQAGFGDAPGSEVDFNPAARAAEEQYINALANGEITEDRDYRRRLNRGQLGTSRVTFGSKLPPGGGGSKWARIVSGSYDESIIIWKKDSNGNWVVGQTLKQGESSASNPNDRIEVDPNVRPPYRQRPQRLRFDDPAVQRMLHGNNPPAAPIQSNHLPTQQAINAAAAMGSGNVMSASQIVQATMNTSLASLQTSVQNIMGLSRTLGAHGTVTNSNVSVNLSSNVPALQSALNAVAARAQSVTNQALANNAALTNQVTHAGGGVALANNLSGGSGSSSSSSSQGLSSQPQTYSGASSAAPHRSASSQLQQQIQQPQAQQQQTQTNRPQSAPRVTNPNSAHASVSRVFKLQFDSRRIVCCSQDSRIVGWDFAAGDLEIEECARFFVGP